MKTIHLDPGLSFVGEPTINTLNSETTETRRTTESNHRNMNPKEPNHEPEVSEKTPARTYPQLQGQKNESSEKGIHTNPP